MFSHKLPHGTRGSNQCRVCVRFENLRSSEKARDLRGVASFTVRGSDQLISHQLLRCYDDLQRLMVERICLKPACSVKTACRKKVLRRRLRCQSRSSSSRASVRPAPHSLLRRRRLLKSLGLAHPGPWPCLCCPARGPDLHTGGDDFDILEIPVCNLAPATAICIWHAP